MEKIKAQKIDIIMFPLMNISRGNIQFYYNAADLLLLTSFSEGSPNVIKEAMACNCPIVATDVGDVKEVISDTLNCKVSNFDLNEMVNSCIDILNKSERSNGRDKISHLDDRIIARKLIEIYTEVVS
jgi:glycosyltransferase involved in cell wall biosynthesis